VNLRILLVVMVLLFGVLTPARAANWAPIDPAQLAATTPSVTPDADAEALLWEVWIEDRTQSSELQTRHSHYLRIKLFNERGVEAFKQVDIQHASDVFVSEIEARTIKPDGSIVELKGGDVFERTIVKGGDLKVKAKSFALPALAPGAIVEYRWNENHINALANYLRLDLQRDIPIQVLKYHIKPLATAADHGYTMQIRYFRQQAVPMAYEGTGFNTATFTNIPAFRSEPYMVPEDLLRRWALIYYSNDVDIKPDKYWRKFARELYKDQKRKAPPIVMELGRNAAQDAKSEEELIARLVEICRTKIRRSDDDASELTPDERKALKPNPTLADVLSSGYGNGRDVLALFLALADAAGIDARYAALPDGGRYPLDPGFTDDYFLAGRSIAVKTGAGWRFLDPAAMHLPIGMLSWREEGQTAVIADPQEAPMPTTPASAPEASLARREARLRLTADGSLEGEVREEFSGHLGARLKEANDDRSSEQREQSLKDVLKGRLSTAELSNVAFENVSGTDKPFVRSYHISVPGYAQRTGRRLFVRPSFFETGGQPLFASSKREHPVAFDFAWSENDAITVELPPGYTLDSPDVPAPLNSAPVASFSITARLVEGRRLEIERKLLFGGAGTLIFPVSSYSSIKAFFDHLHRADDHVFTLKDTAPLAP
jgi:transglutaminase-like putative cysteine protease